MIWSEIFTASAISGVLATAISTFFQAILTERFKASIKSEYDIKVEQAKDEFKHKSDMEIERFKSSLAINAALKQISFQNLQEKRVEKIALCYSALTEVYHALLAYTAVFEPVGGDSKEQRRLKALLP